MFNSDVGDIDLLILDLDNTLYEENDYLFSAYCWISKYIEFKYSIAEGEAFQFLKSTFLCSGRTRLFDKLLEAYQLPAAELQPILSILRSCPFEKKLSLTSKGRDLVDESLKIQKSICILTNGNTIQQQNKVKNIDWCGNDIHLDVVFTYGVFPKPSPKGIYHFISKYGIEKNKVLYIGDNEVDERTAYNAGVRYIDIKNYGEE